MPIFVLSSHFLPSLSTPPTIMNPPPAFVHAGGDDPSPPRRELQLQGPRPAPLKVRKDSYKIKKPPAAPPPQRQTALPPSENHPREPVIIYSISPKVIHTTVNDFLPVVQRLTGNYATSPSASDLAASGAGDLSPAARLASIENTSPPKERDRGGGGGGSAGVMGLVEGVEVGQIPGILSPAPATLPPISPGFFSQAPDPQSASVWQDLNSFLHGSSVISSPSNLFSAPIISPTFSPDLFNLFMDF